MALIRPITLGIKKEASGLLALPAATTQWPKEILQEAYRQIPMLQDLAVTLDMQKVDETHGFGTGKLILKHASYAGQTPEDTKAVIPITVRGRKMDPLDVLLLDGSIYPFSEDKLATHFENLSMGSRTQDKPVTGRGQGFSNLQGYTNPGDGGQGTNVLKLASENLLRVAAATATESARESFEKVAYSPEVVKNAANEETLGALEDALATKALTLGELSSTLESMLEPDVFDIRKKRNGDYEVKTASRHFFSIDTKTLTRIEAEKVVGTEKLASIDDAGRVLAGSDVPGCEVFPLLSEMDPVGTGIYKVANGTGESIAIVVEKPIDITTGQPTSGYIATNTDAYAYQTDLGGEYVSSVSSSPERPNIQDHGIFLWKNAAGEVQATLPATVTAEVSSIDEEASYIVKTATGQSASIHLGNVKTAAVISDGLVIPSTSGFVICPKARTEYRTAEEYLIGKNAALRSREGIEVIPHGPGRYVMRGNAVSAFSGKPQSRDITEFTLKALGVSDPNEALQKTALHGSILVKTPIVLQFESEMRKEAMLTAGRAYTEFPADLGYRDEIVKLAAALPSDRQTINTVLALNFLNPDNLRIIREYIPDIEKTASKLAEVLMATRMGLRGDPEPIRLAMHYVRRVGDQLKTVVPEGV